MMIVRKQQQHFKLLKATGLSILVNGKSEAEGIVQYIGGNITPTFVVTANGASKLGV